ncbi:MAG: amidohydrolase family protein [Spirochaetes bacterium]|nr:amidohydrolase family protein [Spirochaetota bacterium]
MDDIKIIKGNFIDTADKDSFRINNSSYLIVDGELISGICKSLPEQYKSIQIIDYDDSLIIPSFTDLHIHAPQILQRGLGMDMELIDWLNICTFQSERKFENIKYAEEVYSYFTEMLYNFGTLRSCIFGTVHQAANEILAKQLIKNGLYAFVGNVNMDRNSPAYLTEKLHDSLLQTRNFILKYRDNERVKPIITPRFAPSCSHELLIGLGRLAEKYKVPVQSHLSENTSEVQWVKELYPEYRNYSEVYRKHGLFGQTKTLMAHGIYLEPEEIELALNSDVILVHCPDSNLNLSSGIMNVTKYLDLGLKIGLGSDVGAGHSLGMNQVIVRSIQSSKIKHAMDKNCRVLKHSEAFFMATKGNGSFFGNTGNFDKGNFFDALVITDNSPLSGKPEPLDSLYRFLYYGDDRNISVRYLKGNRI